MNSSRPLRYASFTLALRIGRAALLSLPVSVAACAEHNLDPIGKPLDASGGQGGSTGGSGGTGGSTVGSGGAGGTLMPDAGPCPAGSKTTVSGTVYAPNGTLPLYNAIVYVPAGPLEPLESGVTCDRCGKLNSPFVTSTLSDAKGHFELEAPAGSNVPMVIQIGKWRRKVEIPQVRACVDNPIPGAESTRLPKNRTEGDMPRIAVTTGSPLVGQLPCLLPKLGIDPAEFGVADEDRAVTLYYATKSTYGPPGMSDARALWDVPSELAKYDMAIFTPEGSALGDIAGAPTKDAKSFAAVQGYLDMGGRIFTSLGGWVWYKYSPSAEMRASVSIQPDDTGERARTWVELDTSFPKGKALADWLSNLKPAATYGQIQMNEVLDNYDSVDPKAAQVWGRSDAWERTPPGKRPRFITTNTPAGKPAEQQCGKAVNLDALVYDLEADEVDSAFPRSCTGEFSIEKQALAFFFFDMSSCIQKEDAPVVPPIPVLPFPR